MINKFNYYKNFILRIKLKLFLQRFSSLYITIQMYRYKGNRYQRKIIHPLTDITIEGFPRSANSYSVKAFKFSNGEENYKIATHLHAYPQVIKSVEYNKPTLLLIREPLECITSYAAFIAFNIGLDKFNKEHNIKWLFYEYVIYYRNLLKYKDSVVIGEFNEVLNDYGSVIKKVNTKFKTNFKEFISTKENIETVFNTSRDHLSPSKEREQLKKEFINQMKELSRTKLFSEAESLYLKLSNE